MPLLRYFLSVGGALLVLLFIVAAYLPELPATERTTAATDLSTIRIRSDRKWPERIVFDTTRPTIVPPKSALTELRIRWPTGAAGAASQASVREAFAQSASVDPRKEPRRKRRFAARAYRGQPTFMVAQQPHYGFFGNGIW
jgi:hypothetical protein